MQRKTQQLHAILTVFKENPHPISANEVLEKGRCAVPTLNQATVYRTIKKLVEERELIRIVHPIAGNLYERSGKGMHNHFHCHKCDKVFELAETVERPSIALPHGFKAEGFEIFVYGVCGACEHASTDNGPQEISNSASTVR